MFLNLFEEGENPAGVLSTRYLVQRFNANGIEKVRLHTSLSGQNGENRTFEFKRSKTLDVPKGKSTKGVPVGGIERAAKKRVAHQRDERVPPKKKNCPAKEDQDVEFQFSIYPSGHIDMF